LCGRVDAQGQRDIEPNRLARQFGEDGLDPLGVLVANPVELETVGHAQRDDGTEVTLIIDLGCCQRANPGVELLFGQLGGESLAAALPKVSAHCGKLGSGIRRIVRCVTR